MLFVSHNLETRTPFLGPAMYVRMHMYSCMWRLSAGYAPGSDVYLFLARAQRGLASREFSAFLFLFCFVTASL